ncbi:hypothetical protein RhiirC2_797646 [Rhizophagus irregularis]|uniref:Uncharacterized protein n=1 Tax=Rhizophagus irregularis TaxID=588596 RepID=A0A2N1M7R3_9GLOM|nr:hypothetical protein RhiirC2_797646 [Rhizophagus irregularis]
MRNLGVSEKIISATFIPDTTRSANKLQKKKSLLREDEGIDFPDHFSLESVKERLDMYDVSKAPDLQALADVTIMLCIRPAEIKTLQKNEERASQLLTWIQEAISSGQLRDPGKPGVLWFNRFLKKDEFLPETGKPLLSSSLRKLEAVFASVVHRPKNLSKANTYANEALRHSPENHTAPSKRYTIVNMRKRGQPYDQAKAFEFFDEN